MMKLRQPSPVVAGDREFNEAPGKLNAAGSGGFSASGVLVKTW